MPDCALDQVYTESQRERFCTSIPQRRSVRTYIGMPDVAQLSTLAYSAKRLALPGVRMEIGTADEKKLYTSIPFVDTIVGSGKYIAVIANRNVENSAFYAGFCGEAMVLEAVSLGLATCWVGGTYHKKAVDIQLADDEKLLAIISVGIPSRIKHKRAPRKKLTEICTSDPALWPLWAYNAAESVRVAPSALNRQPWRIAYAGRTIQLMKKGGSALDFGIAALHLTLGVEKREHVLSISEDGKVVTLYSEDRG